MSGLLVALAEVVLVGLAGYRATRLVVADSFPPLARPREALERRTLGTRLEWAGDLVTCHFCASGWVTLALVAGLDWLTSTPVPLPVLVWGGSWAVAALVAELEPDK
jgi:Protein of unknown function (DUF1360)